jgi:hypothetical protein
MLQYHARNEFRLHLLCANLKIAGVTSACNTNVENCDDKVPSNCNIFISNFGQLLHKLKGTDNQTTMGSHRPTSCALRKKYMWLGVRFPAERIYFFFFSEMCTPAVGPNQSPIYWVQQIKQAELKLTIHLQVALHLRTGVTTPLLSYCPHDLQRDDFTLTFTRQLYATNICIQYRVTRVNSYT